LTGWRGEIEDWEIWWRWRWKEMGRRRWGRGEETGREGRRGAVAAFHTGGGRRIRGGGNLA